jgi:DNA helicase-2/ATP-dependent DNA helicase PcrA
MSHNLLSGLNESQRAAVIHTGGPLLVLAGPGSGKTRVVTTRIAQLIDNGADSRNVLALTFTNKAASEMATRVSQMVPGHAVWVSTFHRFCSRLLRSYAGLVGLDEYFTIYDTDDSLRLLKDVIESQGIPMARHTPRQIAQSISRAKNELLSHDDLATSRRPIDVIAAEALPHYQKRLISANAVDFDDLLLHLVRLLHDHGELRRDLDERFRYILVDEYQDTNLAQYGIVRGLSIDHPDLTVTGDPDQSIYSWRGANIQNILRFEQDYPGASVIKLEQNYRSSQNIVRVADDLIAANVHRKAKLLRTDNPPGPAVRIVEYESGQTEAEGIVDSIAAQIDGGSHRPRDFAILFRTNALSRGFEHAFRARGIPYQIVRGIEFYKRREIKDVLSYLQLVSNPQDDVAFLRVVNAPPRGIGKVTLRKLRDYATHQSKSLTVAARDPGFLRSISKRPNAAMCLLSDQLKAMTAAATGSVEMLVQQVLEISRYLEHLEDSENEEDQQRLANVEELCTAAKEYDETHDESAGIEGFLEQVALVNETDDWEDESDKVTLMTLHAAKGLEFPAIFVVAVEAGILPHERSENDIDQLEEERRLLFVGVTRAKSRLVLSYARQRNYRGRSRRRVPSSFLIDLRSPAVEFETQEALTWPARNELAEYVAQRFTSGKTPATVACPSSDQVAGELRFESTEFMEDDAADIRSPTETPADRTSEIPSRLLTAAELLEAPVVTPQPEPDAIHLGGLVTHPVFGPGKVVDITGSGKKQQVRIQFIQPAKLRTFYVAFSPLRPIQPPSS